MTSPTPPTGTPAPSPELRRRYWRHSLRLTAALLGAWFVVTFGVAYFARELSFDFFGWPFSFWVGAQGALMAYCLIIWFYARRMARLDADYGMTDADIAHPGS